ENDQKAHALIGLNIEQKFYHVVKYTTYSHEAWRALKKEFTTAVNGLKLMLKCQFYDARMTDKETLLKYLDHVVGITEKLYDLGTKTKETETCYKVLSSIPDTYKPITMAC